MKRSLAVLLTASLLANVGLVAWRAQPADGGLRPPAPPPEPAAPPAPPPQPPEPPTPALWAPGEGESARAFAARLREAAVPDRAARLLVGDALRQQYLARQRELIGSAEPDEFWRSAANAADRDRQAELRALSRAHRDLLAELFGPDESAAAERERARRLYGPLSDEKLIRVDRIHADYGEMAEDIRVGAGGLLQTVDRETLVLLEQERRKDVAAILSPEELELYDLQTSAVARALRVRLATFAPTEKEFRALFALHRAFDERYAPTAGVLDEAHQRERAAAESELDGRIRAALGAARHEEYRRTQEPGFRLTARIAERLGLPTRRAAEVQALARETQARLATLRDDRTLAPEAARTSLLDLARQTGERLASLLGSEGADLYRRASCGAWLRALERTTQTLAATPPTVAAEAEPVAESAMASGGAPAPATAATPASAEIAGEGTAAAGPGAGQRMPLAAQPSG